MRLAYFYDRPFPAPKAAPIQILNTCRAAAELGAEVSVYVRRLAAASEEECLSYYGLAPHRRLRIVPLSGPRSDAWDGRRLRRILRGICAGDGPSAIVARGSACTRVALELGKLRDTGDARFVPELHELSESGARERAAVAAADGLVCVNRSLGEAVERAFGADRPILVLPSGTAVPERLAETPHDIDVIWCGKLRWQKGPADLVEAMRFLPDRTLWLVGGERGRGVKEVAELAERLGISSRVVLFGYVEPARIPELIARARVGVCPIRAGAGEADLYTSPLKLLELMAHGVPAVATRVPAVLELAEHDRTAWLVEPNDPEGLAHGIRTVLEQPELAERLAREGRRHVRQFAWERRAGRLLEFVHSLEAHAVPDRKRA